MNINSNAVVQSVISANTDQSVSCRLENGTIVDVSDAGLVLRNMPGSAMIFAIDADSLAEMCFAYWNSEHARKRAQQG